MYKYSSFCHHFKIRFNFAKKTKTKLQIPRSKFENEKKNNQQPYKKTKKKKHTKKTIAN